METGTQETQTTEKLTLETPDLSQGEYEQLRDGKEVVREKSAPVAKAASETTDESDTSDLEAQESEADDESGDESDEASDAAKPKKKSGTQRRIEKLVKQRAEAEREREYWREQALKTQTKPEPVKPEVKALETGKPRSDDFDTYDSYVEALTEWKADQKLNARDEASKKEAQAAQAKVRVKAHNERVDALRKDHPDFDEHAANFFADHGADFKLSKEFQDILTESENSAQILHELFKTPEEFLRINSLSSFDAARAIGLIEGKISSASKETKETTIKPKLTKAPPPAKPVSATSANGKKSIYDDDVSQAEYERMRAEQEKRRRGA